MTIAEKIIRAKTDYDEVYEAGKKQATPNVPTDGDDSRTHLFCWYAYLRSQYGDRWDEYYDDDYEYVFPYYDDDSTWLESVAYPKGTSNIINFKYALCTLVWEETMISHSWLECPTKRFTGFLDLSNAKDIFRIGLTGKYLEDLGTIKFPQHTGYQSTTIGSSRTTKLRVEGKIFASLDFKNAPLDLESAKSIIYALVSYAETDYDFMFRITFSNETKALLDEAGPIFNGYMWYSYLSNFGWMY